MVKKARKYLIFSSALLVLSLLLVSCQSMITSTEEMDRKRVLDAWTANLTAQGESYQEEIEQTRVPLVELRSDVPPEAEVMVQAIVPNGAPRWDILPKAEVMVDAFTPGIEIRRTRLAAKTFLTVYTVTSDRPAWVVFHADEEGVPGAILEYVFVESGTHRIGRAHELEELSSERIHVMMHEDLGTIGLFEFPGPDGPVYIGSEIINELCFCSF